MDKIIVKNKKGHPVLELSEDICIFQISKEARRKFQLQDIARVERYGDRLNAYVYLKDQTGKILAQFRMNMENGPAVLRFFRDCNLGKITDKNGQPMPAFEIIVLKEEITATLEGFLGLTGAWAGFWGIMFLLAVYDWLLTEYQTIDWVFFWILIIFTLPAVLAFLAVKLFCLPDFLRRDRKGLRILSSVLNIAGIVLACFLWKLPFSVVMKIDVIYPVLVWVLYLCFHRNMCWFPLDPKKVMVPYVGVLYLDFISNYYVYMYPIHTESVWNVRLGIFALFSILFLLFSYDCDNWLPRAWRIGVLAWVTLFGMEGLPALFNTGVSYHHTIEVMEKEIHHNPRGAEGYYILLPLENGYAEWERISEAFYNKVEAGEEIVLCYHESVLSDYCYFHCPEEECEDIWHIREKVIR